MLIHWLMIFLLLADFILIILMNNTGAEDRQWIGVDANDNRLSGGSDLLPKINYSGAPIEVQKIPILLSHQGTTNHTKRNEDDETSSRRRDYFIAVLSKIAKVRSFQENPVSIGRGSMANIYNVARKESAYLRNRVSAKDTGTLTHLDTKLSLKLPSNGIFENPSDNGIRQKNFHCQAVRDVYVPEIKENVPSYACTSGSKTFILSSKRFLEDRRNSLRVNVDDDMLRKLNDPAVTLANSRFNVIPAVLLLKPGRENYDVRNQQSIGLYEQQTIDDENI